MLSDYIFYKIINKNDFLEFDLPIKDIEVILENIGLVTVRVVKGNIVGLVYDGVFLAPINDKNPFEFEGYSLYTDDDSNIWLGILKDD